MEVIHTDILPQAPDMFWSKPARDMAQVLITFGGYDKTELINRLIAKVTSRNKLIQERHVLEIADEILNESKGIYRKVKP